MRQTKKISHKNTSIKQKRNRRRTYKRKSFRKMKGGNNPPLIDAINDKNTKLAIDLINKNNINEIYGIAKMTPLLKACQNSNLEIVKALIDKGADTKMADSSGKRALHYACQFGDDMELIKYLIQDQHMDVNMTDNDDRTPLHWSCFLSNKPDVVEFLIDQHADVNKPSKSTKKTPLHYACELGSTEVVKILVDKGKANVNALDYKGKPPLYYSCNANEEITNFLIENGVDTNIFGCKSVWIKYKSSQSSKPKRNELLEFIYDTKDTEHIEEKLTNLIDTHILQNSNPKAIKNEKLFFKVIDNLILLNKPKMFTSILTHVKNEIPHIKLSDIKDKHNRNTRLLHHIMNLGNASILKDFIELTKDEQQNSS